MSAHTKRSPSQAERFGKCPGALALCEALPEHQKNVGGAAAKLGTCVHGLIEHCLGKGDNPEDYRGRIITIIREGQDDEGVSILRKSAKTPVGQYWAEVDDDMIDGAALMVDYVRGRIAELGEGTELELESRTNPLPDRDDTSGTADATVKAWPVVLEVVDYKNGWNTVEHFDNQQLSAYLLGKAVEADWEYADYWITVVQPNAEHEDGRIRTFKTNAEDLKAFAKEYRAKIERCEEAEADKGAPTAGFKTVNPKWAAKHLVAAKMDEKNHCMFCDAKAVCPAYITRRSDEAQIDFDDEPTDLPKPTTEQDVARIMRWKPAFDALFKAAFMFGQRSLENGFEVPGFKLARTKPHRRWLKLSEDELATRLMKEFKLKREQIFHDKLKTGPQVEKLLPKEKRDSFSSTMLYSPEGTLTIVPDEDKRDAVLAHPGDDFEDDTDFG